MRCILLSLPRTTANLISAFPPLLASSLCRYFGSGVILATGFIHLLEPAADEELSEGNTISAGGCISDKWGLYPFAFGICLVSLFFTFVIHLVAFRIGTERLQKMGLAGANAGGHDHPHAGGHHVQSETPSSMESSEQALEKGMSRDTNDDSMFADAQERSPLAAQVSIAELESFDREFTNLLRFNADPRCCYARVWCHFPRG